MQSIVKNNRLLSALNLSKRAFGAYKWQIVVLTALAFVGGILEGIGINALIPLFSFIAGQNTVGTDIISRFIAGLFDFFHLNLNIKYLLAFIIVLFAAKSVIMIGLEYIKIRITADYEQKTRTKLLKKILDADWPHLIKQKLGYLETVLMIDITASANLLRQISAGITTLTGLCIYLLIALNISFVITLVTFALGLLFFLIIKPLVYRTKVAANERVAVIKKVSHFVNENILGIKTVKTMEVGGPVFTRAQKYFETLKSLWIRVAMLQTVSTSFVQPVSVIFISLVFAFLYKSPNFNIGSLAAIVYLIHRIFMYIEQLQRTWHIVSDIYPHLKKTLDFDEAADISKERNLGSRKFTFNEDLQFRNVDFFYNPEQSVLSKLNFHLKKGEIVGLVGPSGVGKTTVVDLILRLLQPVEGQILLDGVDISDIELQDFRRNIGYVSQDIFLINDTIANNIRFYDDSITDAQIIEVAQMANIDEFIDSCPNKYETVIGERGITLSAGQRQRIVIARILVRKPQLLILDEATSALDNESEAQIQKVINGLKKKITIFAIAHRLTTVMDSDRLIVIKNGTVAEQGDPKELLRDKDSYFFKTYNITA